MCDVCGSATVLDPSSATELLSLFPLDKEDDISRRKTEPTKNNSYRPYIPEKSMHMTTSPSREVLPLSRVCCKTHPDEYITYYCFDCQSSPICAECVIHGVHIIFSC